MQVAHQVRQRHQIVLDVVGDLLRHRAVRVAGEAAVQVALVDRRGAPPGHRGGEVGGGQDDHTAPDARRVERFGQVAQRDLALVFVTVVAGHEQHGRAVAVPQHHDGDRDEAVGRAVHRMEQPQEAVLAAVLGEIDLGDDAGSAGRHRRDLSDWPSGWACGAAAGCADCAPVFNN